MATIYSDGRTLEAWIQPSSATALSQSRSHKMPAAIWEQLNMLAIGVLRLGKGIRKEKEEEKEEERERGGGRVRYSGPLGETKSSFICTFLPSLTHPSATSPGWQP